MNEIDFTKPLRMTRGAYEKFTYEGRTNHGNHIISFVARHMTRNAEYKMLVNKFGRCIEDDDGGNSYNIENVPEEKKEWLVLYNDSIYKEKWQCFDVQRGPLFTKDRAKELVAQFKGNNCFAVNINTKTIIK